MPYRTLNPDQIVATLERLERRINERFPGAGLARVCADLLDIARGAKGRVEKISRPNIPIRLSVATVLALGVLVLGYIASIIEVKAGAENLFGVLEGIDAFVNILVVTGAGMFS